MSTTAFDLPHLFGLFSIQLERVAYLFVFRCLVFINSCRPFHIESKKNCWVIVLCPGIEFKWWKQEEEKKINEQ